MKKVAITLSLALLPALIGGFVTNAQARTKLEERGALGKLIGNWVSTTDDGRTVTLTYRWRLDKNAIVTQYNIGGQYAGYGFAYYNPADGKIHHAGVDCVGGLGEGIWEFDDDKATWKMKYVGADSQERKMGIVYTREGRKALKLQYYGLDESGKITGEPRMTTDFQRQTAKQKKKSKLPEPSQTATLADLVDMGGFDWVMGNWAGNTNEGQKLDLSYSWGMNKNLINIAFKMGESESLGMVFYSPHDGKVMHIDVDNKGNLTKGVWDAEGDNLVATLDYRGIDGKREKFAAIHSNIDAKTIKLEFYGIGESGDRMSNPWTGMEFKRQPKKAAAKARAKKKPKTE